jgi:inner membrane protein
MLTALHFLTHVGMSWILASLGRRSVKDRWLIALAGVLPDLDGAGILIGQHAYDAFHRAAGHGLAFVALWTALTLRCADRPLSAAALAVVSFHVHLLLDLVGTGGPPIRYFWPLAEWGATYTGRWTLASWQNAVVMSVTLLGALWVGWRTARLSRCPAPGYGDAGRAPGTTSER